MSFRARSVEIANYLAMGVHTYRGRVLVQASFWVAAVVLGGAAVLFTKLITKIQAWNASLFLAHPYWMSVLTPVGFVLAAALVKFLAPYAGGSGLPQVLHAASLRDRGASRAVESGLLSIRTAVVKVFSTSIGFLAGASIGGEGPTVQISGAIFAEVGRFMKKYFPHLDFHSYIVAAAGAGIASAFNTPLGGVVFALEEVSVGDFGELRHMVMLAVVIAGLTSQAFVGNQFYFGETFERGGGWALLAGAALIGVAGGLLGGLFGKIVASRRLHEVQLGWWQRALACGLVVAVIGLLFHGQTAGSGYDITHDVLGGGPASQPILFPLAKLLSTAFSTLSGMGGGILAPSLSIGAWTGISIGKLAMLADLRVCALLGMVAYFAGAFQIPMTAVVVVMETTNEHDVIIPMMVSAVFAYVVARLIMPESLYHVLVARSFRKAPLSD
jgi:H+/Cl- antiporter ClcA